MADAGGKKRIGQQPQVALFNAQGRMADVGDGVHKRNYRGTRPARNDGEPEKDKPGGWLRQVLVRLCSPRALCSLAKYTGRLAEGERLAISHLLIFSTLFV